MVDWYECDSDQVLVDGSFGFSGSLSFATAGPAGGFPIKGVHSNGAGRQLRVREFSGGSNANLPNVVDVTVLLGVDEGRRCEFTRVRHFASELGANHANVYSTANRSVGGLRVVGLVGARYNVRFDRLIDVLFVPRGIREGFEVRNVRDLCAVYGA